MSILDSLILGFIQGLTEFLPVSSSGHLVLMQKILGVIQHDIAFDVVVHLATVGAVFTIYWSRLKQVAQLSIAGLKERRINVGLQLVGLTFIGTLPAVVVGLFLKGFFESLFNSIFAVGLALTLTGFILFFTKRRGDEKGFELEDQNQLGPIHIKPLWAVLIGLAQAAAIAPGVSRSGTTIAVGLYLGLPRNQAAFFSFLLAIPAIIGAAVLQLKDVVWATDKLVIYGAGFVSAYGFGVAGLWAVIHLVKRGRLDYFSYYLWLLGPLCIYLSRP